MTSRLLRLLYDIKAIGKCDNSYILRVSNNKFELGFSYKITSDFINFYDTDVKENTFNELHHENKIIELDNNFLRSVCNDLLEYYSKYALELKDISNKSEVKVYDEFHIYSIPIKIRYTKFNVESNAYCNYIEFLNKEM